MREREREREREIMNSMASVCRWLYLATFLVSLATGIRT